MSKKIDPRIYLPPVAGYSHEQQFGMEFGGPGEAYDFEIPAPIREGLQPPDSIDIVEQVYRKDASGRTVVDLVIEVQDMPGATEYQVRTAIV